jgi:predicted DNA-binding protein
MSATRTQIYLTDEQRRRIDAVTRAEGVTLAEVVRRAIDDYLRDEAPDPERALERTFGVAPDVAPPSRDEWDRG